MLDLAFDETSAPAPQIHAPIQPPQTNPQRHRPTNTHTHTTTDTHPQIPHPYRHPQTGPNRPPHTYTPANRHTTQAPTTLTLTPTHSTPTQPPSAIRQARYQTGHVSTGHTILGQAIDPASDETSRPASANFSAKPDSGLIRDAIRADAVVDVDAPMLTLILMQVPACRCRASSPTYSRA